MGSGIAIIMIPAPVKLLRGPRGPRIFLLGLTNCKYENLEHFLQIKD